MMKWYQMFKYPGFGISTLSDVGAKGEGSPVGCNIHLTNEIIPFMHKRISICDPCIINLKETLLSIIWNGSVMDHSESMCHQYLLSISHPRLDRIRGGTFHALRCIITDLRTKISVSFLFISGFRFESKCIN